MEGAARTRLTWLSTPPILRRATTLESVVSKVPEDLLYTPDHEYVARTNDSAILRIGITDYAQGELGDVVFVRLPKEGDRFTAHQSFGEIEAVKAVSELYSPVSGEVAEVNHGLDSDSGVVNRDPYGDGWMIKLRVSNLAELKELMSAKAYRSHIGE
jgi:glycine cleavage system H protein